MATLATLVQQRGILGTAIRVWRGLPDEGGTFRGTAFMVGPTLALTARHVVGEGQPSEYAIHATWHGGFLAQVASIEPHSSPGVDVALLTIDPQSAAPRAQVLSLRSAPPLQIGEDVCMVGFADQRGAVQPRIGRIQGFDGLASAPVAHPLPAKGMSGGPVIGGDGVLRGAMWARDVDKGVAYLTPLSSFFDFLVAHGVEVDGSQPRMPDEIDRDLRRYRTHDALFGTGAMTREMGRLSARFHTAPLLMPSIVYSANAARMAIDPGDEGGKVIVVEELPPAATVSPAEYWTAALAQASRKSPRMHAALLLTLLADAPLSSEDLCNLLKVLDRLKK